MFIFVTTRYSITGLSAVNGAEINRVFDLIGNFGTLGLTILDAWVNRQPYYATFHAFVGVLCCWGYLIFNVVWVLTGGHNEMGLPYIYRSFNWLSADVAHFFTPGKITLKSDPTICFDFACDPHLTPCFNQGKWGPTAFAKTCSATTPNFVLNTNKTITVADGERKGWCLDLRDAQQRVEGLVDLAAFGPRLGQIGRNVLT